VSLGVKKGSTRAAGAPINALVSAIRQRCRGFTLVELVAVIAIIGLLASIAIPSFFRYQLRARSTEAPTNLAAIATSQESYFAEFGIYGSVPSPVPPLLRAPAEFRGQRAAISTRSAGAQRAAFNSSIRSPRAPAATRSRFRARAMRLPDGRSSNSPARS
jgi:type IV pilus assembly protein PilA